MTLFEIKKDTYVVLEKISLVYLDPITIISNIYTPVKYTIAVDEKRFIFDNECAALDQMKRLLEELKKCK